MAKGITANIETGRYLHLTTYGEYAFARYVRSRIAVEQLISIGITDVCLDDNLGPQLDMEKILSWHLSDPKSSP